MKITIREINKPRHHRERISDELKWICESLGLMAGRDVEDTSFRIMKELLNEFRTKTIVPTECLVRSLKMEAPRINHHIRNLMETGILSRKKRKITLKGGSLSAAIEEMKRESDRMFERILEVSKKIDDRFF
ncbi:ArsR family transcriptional regulator [Candidatus Pacearchaeota archaeon]|nr:ArsR family transcriptional regulator [Candidatus Pacearchaeota archaeon]MBD3283333.1 ArsR family transcriptional regulator [Candidatus Pacearchaeota archaeon]